MNDSAGDSLIEARDLEALEAWHARYNRAIASGRDAAEAVAEADTTPEEEAAIELQRERRDSLRVLVPRSEPVARAYDSLRAPEVAEYDEVWITPHELRRVAARKLGGEQL